ncbi:uncharacterized protein LOC110097044 isoform X2 [Dendrobium catenatum]|uniref:uncharacterized protein LOC110097044 isoform X2 n=1 Tax=Dendrobium catenatum TaxID=906689 RepID=UPI00109FE726|nr:uncharacterized protein LOC110097044 isoform X2 [Dendrobium catenatum]
MNCSQEENQLSKQSLIYSAPYFRHAQREEERIHLIQISLVLGENREPTPQEKDEDDNDDDDNDDGDGDCDIKYNKYVIMHYLMNKVIFSKYILIITFFMGKLSIFYVIFLIYVYDVLFMYVISYISSYGIIRH